MLVVFLLGAGASWGGLWQVRNQFVFESFEVAVPGDAPAPVDRVALSGRRSFPVSFLLLHGYIANRRQLLHLAQVLAASGAEVYVMDLPGRGDHAGGVSPRPEFGPTATLPTPRENQAAVAVVGHIRRTRSVPPWQMVLVGHSLGGGVALEVARSYRPLAVVSLAGLERPVRPGEPPNPLFITAHLEVAPLREAADRMHARAQPGRAERREFLAIHSTLPFHSLVQRALVDWTNRALARPRLELPPHLNTLLLALETLTMFFLAALFLSLSALMGWLVWPEPYSEVVPEARMTLWASVQLGGYGLLAGSSAVSLLALLAWAGVREPLRFLGLLDGDYLAAMLLVATVWLAPALRNRPWIRSGHETLRKVAAAAVLAACLLVPTALFLTWQLYDFWPTPRRALTALFVLPLAFVYSLAENLLVRTCARRQGATPFGVRMVWRAPLLVAIAYGVLALGSGAVLLVLMAVPLALVSLLQHFFSEAVYRALSSVYACAVFDAVLLAWFLACVFPLR